MFLGLAFQWIKRKPLFESFLIVVADWLCEWLIWTCHQSRDPGGVLRYGGVRHDEDSQGERSVSPGRLPRHEVRELDVYQGFIILTWFACLVCMLSSQLMVVCLCTSCFPSWLQLVCFLVFQFTLVYLFFSQLTPVCLSVLLTVNSGLFALMTPSSVWNQTKLTGNGTDHLQTVVILALRGTWIVTRLLPKYKSWTNLLLEMSCVMIH